MEIINTFDKDSDEIICPQGVIAEICATIMMVENRTETVIRLYACNKR